MGLYSKIIDLQKLLEAWKQVYKNKPKEGVDGTTCEQFDIEKKTFLKELNGELKEHTYECEAVKLIPHYKGEKVRFISLYCMRDKVVQTSIAAELSKIYEPQFSRACYAYRSGQSALQASEKIAEKIQMIKEGYVLKADIHAFFDHILHKKLREKLLMTIREEDVLDLIFKGICARAVDRDGVLSEKTRGVYQGSSVSPVLSNIYMKEFDFQVEKEVKFYVRYSDDMILFFDKKEEAEGYVEKLKMYLEALGLELNLDKTKVASLEEGFEFLGYRFDTQGRKTPAKAEVQLSERLEEIWMNPAFRDLETRLTKGQEILTGWEQFYRDEREIGSILEYVVLTSILRKKGRFDAQKMGEKRLLFDNPYKDIAEYLEKVWKEEGRVDLQLLEYEQYQMIYDEEEKLESCDTPLGQELLRLHEEYLITRSEEYKTELMQIYSDLKQYHKAEKLMSRKIPDTKLRGSVKLQKEGEREIEIQLSQNELLDYMEWFVGREDLYTTDTVGADKRRKVEEVLEPLTPEVIRKHLDGNRTVGTFLQRSNSTVKYLVVDLDISKKVLLNHPDEETQKGYLQKALKVAELLIKELRHMGLNGSVEYSGYRGYHVWIFFEEWIPVRYALLLSDVLSKKIAEEIRDGDIQAEYFPNKTRLIKGRRGQCMKLPMGIHPISQKRSVFLDEDFEIYQRQQEALGDFTKCSLKSLKKVISAEMAASDLEENGQMEVDNNIEEFGQLSEEVRVVLSSCNLVRYLCQKARKTHYLTHFERLTILYVFAHLGEEGQDFIHKVMSFLLNYNYQTTQKFIMKCPEKPISCLKLREQYKQISAEIGCSCVFKRSKDCYPSPVLHALKKASDTSQITIPMSRTVTEQKKEQIKEEISLPIKIQTIVEKMMELKKQSRAIGKNLEKYEMELQRIFDENKTDSFEIKQGVLTRRKYEGKVEWIIEL